MFLLTAPVSRLRRDTLSSSDNAQDCGDTQWARTDPRLRGRNGPVPSRPLLCCKLTPQPRQKLLRGPKAESATPAARVLPLGAGPGAAPGTPHRPVDPREQASQVQQGGGAGNALPHTRRKHHPHHHCAKTTPGMGQAMGWQCASLLSMKEHEETPIFELLFVGDESEESSQPEAVAEES